MPFTAVNSFVGSFKGLLAAACVVAIIEPVIFAVHPSTFVERSNYLDWNYDTPELFQKAIIYDKLNTFAHSAPDVVIVGDSTALHNVIPDIVTKYVGGLKIVNLGSIANAGFDGHYAMAEFMFRRNPHIKALVLYVSLNHLPNGRDGGLLGGDALTGGADRIESSFTAPSAYLNPPSMALRPAVTDAVYSKWGTLSPRRTTVFPEGGIWGDMLDSIRGHNGWWPEHDPRFAGQRLQNYWRLFCGDNGVRAQADTDDDYRTSPLLGRQSYLRLSLLRFADLAARHNAKFIAMFQPNPCKKWEGSYLPARLADLEYLRAHNGNFAFAPETLFEHWPMREFVTYDHLRVGYDEWNSERVGRLLAKALGLSAAAPSEAEFKQGPLQLEGAARSVLSHADAGHAVKVYDGISVKPCERCDGSPGGLEMIENGKSEWHGVNLPIDGLEPGATYVISAIVKAVGDRGIRLDVLHPSGSLDQADLTCNMGGLEVQRGVAVDAGLDVLPDGWLRCWVAATVAESEARLGIALLDHGAQLLYPATGNAGVLLKDLTVQPASRR
jgi:hypothetical protein